MEYIYRLHAIERMFQRDIEEQDVVNVIERGIIIEEYLNDKPYPSYLAMGKFNNKVLHVVYAKNAPNNIIVITTYIPDPEKWTDDFKKRKA